MPFSTVSIPVPDAIGGVSAWIPNTLARIGSAGLLVGAAAGDQVQLCGTNDSAAPVTAALAIASYAGFGGPSNQANAGLQGAALGAWEFYAVIRTEGTTHGLTFELGGAT